MFTSKAPYGIANGMGCSAENFAFRSRVNSDGNLLSCWPKDTRGIVVFDFEIGLVTSELRAGTSKVGLFGEKGLFKQSDVGL